MNTRRAQEPTHARTHTDLVDHCTHRHVRQAVTVLARLLMNGAQPSTHLVRAVARLQQAVAQVLRGENGLQEGQVGLDALRNHGRDATQGVGRVLVTLTAPHAQGGGLVLVGRGGGHADIIDGARGGAA